MDAPVIVASVTSYRLPSNRSVTFTKGVITRVRPLLWFSVSANTGCELNREHFKTVDSVGRTYHPYSRRDEHFEIFLCRGLNQDPQTLWPNIKKWG